MASNPERGEILLTELQSLSFTIVVRDCKENNYIQDPEFIILFYDGHAELNTRKYKKSVYNTKDLENVAKGLDSTIKPWVGAEDQEPMTMSFYQEVSMTNLEIFKQHIFSPLEPGSDAQSKAQSSSKENHSHCQ